MAFTIRKRPVRHANRKACRLASRTTHAVGALKHCSSWAAAFCEAFFSLGSGLESESVSEGRSKGIVKPPRAKAFNPLVEKSWNNWHPFHMDSHASHGVANNAIYFSMAITFSRMALIAQLRPLCHICPTTLEAAACK